MRQLNVILKATFRRQQLLREVEAIRRASHTLSDRFGRDMYFTDTQRVLDAQCSVVERLYNSRANPREIVAHISVVCDRFRILGFTKRQLIAIGNGIDLGKTATILEFPGKKTRRPQKPTQD